jgi:hypothetical protein
MAALLLLIVYDAGEWDQLLSENPGRIDFTTSCPHLYLAKAPRPIGKVGFLVSDPYAVADRVRFPAERQHSLLKYLRRHLAGGRQPARGRMNLHRTGVRAAPKVPRDRQGHQRTGGAALPINVAFGTKRFPFVATNVVHEGVTKTGGRPWQHNGVGSQLDHPSTTPKSSACTWNWPHSTSASTNLNDSIRKVGRSKR